MPLRNTSEDDSLMERVSYGLANVGKERVSRKNMDSNAYRDEVSSMRTARGGSTPKPAEKLSWSERRAADRVLKEGKQPRGKR